MLAEKISAECTQAVIDWGDAVRKAEANPTNEAYKMMANLAAKHVLTLAVGISKTLHPGIEKE